MTGIDCTRRGLLGWKAVTGAIRSCASKHLATHGQASRNIRSGRSAPTCFAVFNMGVRPALFHCHGESGKWPIRPMCWAGWRPLQGFSAPCCAARTAWGLASCAAVVRAISAPVPAQGQIPHRGAIAARARPAVEPGRVILARGPNRAEFIVIGAMKCGDRSTICSYPGDHPDTYNGAAGRADTISARRKTSAPRDAGTTPISRPRTTETLCGGGSNRLFLRKFFIPRPRRRMTAYNSNMKIIYKCPAPIDRSSSPGCKRSNENSRATPCRRPLTGRWREMPGRNSSRTKPLLVQPLRPLSRHFGDDRSTSPSWRRS